MTKVEALTKVLAASDALHAHDDEWGTPAALGAQATYDAVMAECDPVLGPEAMDRLASICTGERWSPEDMLNASKDPAEVERMLARITAEGEPLRCRMCEEIGSGFGPSHDGSPRCESGSIASGGTHAHCTCDTCF